MRRDTTTSLGRAAEVCRGGGVVLCPAETVYGLSGDARRPDVAARIHALKGSAPDKPILALTDAWERVAPWVRHDDRLRRLWRRDDLGPLTLVLPATDAAPAALVGPDGTVGLRRTTSPTARALVEALGAPLFSTSANRSGEPPPARLADVDAGIRRGVDAVLDAPTALAGRPSTVARYHAGEGRFEILRPGPVTADALAA